MQYKHIDYIFIFSLSLSEKANGAFIVRGYKKTFTQIKLNINRLDLK